MNQYGDAPIDPVRSPFIPVASGHAAVTAATYRRATPSGRQPCSAVSSALLGVLACGDDPAGPSPGEGVYSLRQLNGSPLPYDHEGLGCCIYLSGSMELDGGRYEAGITFENRNNGQVATIMEWGTYARPSASQLGFTRDSFVVVPLLMDVATVSVDTIRVAWGGEGPGSPDQFQALYVREP